MLDLSSVRRAAASVASEDEAETQQDLKQHPTTFLLQKAMLEAMIAKTTSTSEKYVNYRPWI